MFLSWIGHHGRSAALAAELEVPTLWFARRGPLPVAYLRSAVRTVVALRRARPDVVVVMLPPWPALVAALLARPRARILADLHTGVFLDPRWTWSLPITLRLLRGRHAAIVTNEPLAELCRRRGVTAFVLHDLIGGDAVDRVQPVDPDPTVLVPLSYANDEPVAQILAAAAALPAVRFVLTGSAPDDVRKSAPINVTFSGYLSNDDYATTLRSAHAVLALTTRELTMQRAGYEALEAGVPVVTSDFDVLRDFFGTAAVYTAADATAIAGAVTDALHRQSQLRSAAHDRRAEVIIEQQAALADLQEWTALARTTTGAR